jgi:uncharacterized protein YrrD
MERLLSRTEPNTILGVVFRKSEMLEQVQAGVDLTPEHDFLQVRSIKASEGKVFKAHKHLPQDRITSLTQESLIIIQGAIEACIYDLDDRPLAKRVLLEGDCIILLRGGHAFTIIMENTIFYEFKNGPYYGPEKCKVMIEEPNA